jgi:peptide/nickel transport system substrate-binding protein
MKKAIVLAAALLLISATAVHAQEKPRSGGILTVATIGEPPTLDLQATTTVLTYEIMWHVYEPLFAHDRTWTPVPHLAEAHVVSDKGLRQTITLRRGVKFHNGKEMTAADVVASLQRWGKVATVGKVLWPNVETIEAKDPYTVVIHLKQPSASLVYGLAEPSAMIYTREVAETAPANQVKEFIGTGPYRFVEHRAVRHV